MMSNAERLDFRIESEVKQQFSDAAQAFGMNLTTFMVAATKEMTVRVQRMKQWPPLPQRRPEAIRTPKP